VYIPHTFDTAGPPDIPIIRDYRPLTDLFNRLQYLGQFWTGAVAWPAILQYKWYDPQDPKQGTKPPLYDFERQPLENTENGEVGLNELQTKGDKTWDLAWVYTVIAGVLNILVIYDAAAGPALGIALEPRRPLKEAAT